MILVRFQDNLYAVCSPICAAVFMRVTTDPVWVQNPEKYARDAEPDPTTLGEFERGDRRIRANTRQSHAPV